MLKLLTKIFTLKKPIKPISIKTNNVYICISYKSRKA